MRFNMNFIMACCFLYQIFIDENLVLQSDKT